MAFTQRMRSCAHGAEQLFSYEVSFDRAMSSMESTSFISIALSGSCANQRIELIKGSDLVSLP